MDKDLGFAKVPLIFHFMLAEPDLDPLESKYIWGKMIFAGNGSKFNLTNILVFTIWSFF